MNSLGVTINFRPLKFFSKRDPNISQIMHFFGKIFTAEGKWVHFGSGFSTVSPNYSRFGCNQSCKIVCLILMPFQILYVVAHKIICSNPKLFLDQSS
jgi:hypothetical protein